MKETLKEGIKTVVAPQLFPTPPAIAERMVELAEIEAGQRILEPSAGTGAILRQLPELADVIAVEINENIADSLAHNGRFQDYQIMRGDFLNFNGDLGTFDRIIMNPPFENAVDIKHINHALTMLKPGGRLVALCANGPRQQAAFKETADHWEALEPGSFKEQGTNVNVALLVIDKPGEEAKEDPEKNLRDLWTKQGVSEDRQQELIDDVTAKAQPGAQIGPWTIPKKHNQTTGPEIKQGQLF